MNKAIKKMILLSMFIGGTSSMMTYYNAKNNKPTSNNELTNSSVSIDKISDIEKEFMNQTFYLPKLNSSVSIKNKHYLVEFTLEGLSAYKNSLNYEDNITVETITMYKDNNPISSCGNCTGLGHALAHDYKEHRYDAKAKLSNGVKIVSTPLILEDLIE